jgi:hypothetical protein
MAGCDYIISMSKGQLQYIDLSISFSSRRDDAGADSETGAKP